MLSNKNTLLKNDSSKCDICGDVIGTEISGWGGGHNAEPVVENGRCCSDCNTIYVLPLRIAAFYETGAR